MHVVAGLLPCGYRDFQIPLRLSSQVSAQVRNRLFEISDESLGLRTQLLSEFLQGFQLCRRRSNRTLVKFSRLPGRMRESVMRQRVSDPVEVTEGIGC